MDLQALAQAYFHPTGAIYTGPGQSYGPAQSRYTRTPIKFVDQSQMQSPVASGEYYPDTKTIQINPYAAQDNGGVGQVTRHESIHAALDFPNSEQYTTNAQNYIPIASAIKGQVGGVPQNEVPAYMGSNPTPQFNGVSQSQRDQYLTSLLGMLQHSGVRNSAMFQQLLNAGSDHTHAGARDLSNLANQNMSSMFGR